MQMVYIFVDKFEEILDFLNGCKNFPFELSENQMDDCMETEEELFLAAVVDAEGLGDFDGFNEYDNWRIVAETSNGEIELRPLPIGFYDPANAP